jgi:8-oxo-dGTP pyrophosphatase MutT (NUDIX family)
MYKVFIENRPIIFTQKNTKQRKSYSIAADMVESIEKDLLPVLHSITEDQELYVICEDEKTELDRLFKSYEKISAAGGIVRRKNKLLFIKRNGFWDIPKGKLDDGESPEDGALREIEEECGISGMQIQNLIIETYHTYLYNGIPTLKRTFWYAIDYTGTKEVQGQLEEGITKVKWYKKDDLKKIRQKTFASIVEVIDAYLRQIDLN